MTVEYFTPSKEDIEQASHRLLVIQAQLANSPILYRSDEMTVLDFSHLYSEEEKAIARQHLLEHTPSSCFGNVEFTSHQPYDVAQTKAMARHMLGHLAIPKHFHPSTAQSPLPDERVRPDYRVKEVKTINGQKVTFYGQDLSKDKK